MSTKQTEKWKLLEPIKVGPAYLRNRIVMAAMYTRFATVDGAITQEMIDYFAERAKGSLAAIIVEYSYITEGGRGRLHQLGIHNDSVISGLKQLADTIKANGTRAILQIAHAGRQKSPDLTWIPLVAPSRISHYHRVPRVLTIPEIEDIVGSFAEAARRAKQANFDGVEIHGAHGYLLSQFLSPYLNRRTDKYGGALENRASVALEIVRKMRERVGDEFILGYRMNGNDYIPRGLTPDQAARFARMLQDTGIDYIHVSAGMEPRVDFFIQPTYIERGSLIHLAERVKEAVEIPVITVGSLNVELAEKALREGKADLVAFGRALLADPQLVDKLASGRIEDIRPCIRGNGDCLNMEDSIKCEVNPACGREARFKIVPAETKKSILVVGGGIAGIEAARVAALRGHKVTLIEKTDRLGGHLVEASVPSFKNDIKQLLSWSINQIYKGDIEIKLNTEATPELVAKLKPDVLVVAVGSDYAIPDIKGIGRQCVVKVDDVLLGKRTVGERTVVLGGGRVGCEVALYIAEHLEKTVAIVEVLDDILTDCNFTVKLALMERLEEAGVDIHVRWCPEEITDGQIICRDQLEQRHKLASDTVVLATGLVERSSLVEKLKGLASELYFVGDCVKACNISQAMENAWEAMLHT